MIASIRAVALCAQIPAPRAVLVIPESSMTSRQCTNSLVAVGLVSPLTNLDLIRELDEARSEADVIIARTQKRLDDLPSPRAELKEFLLAARELRRQLGEALVTGRREQDREQRDGDAGGVRKAILAIWLQVTRLAGMWEACARAAPLRRPDSTNTRIRRCGGGRLQ